MTHLRLIPQPMNVSKKQKNVFQDNLVLTCKSYVFLQKNIKITLLRTIPTNWGSSCWGYVMTFAFVVCICSESLFEDGPPGR